MILERAPAKLNLLLWVGPPRADGLHSVCSLFVTLDLEDDVRVELAEAAEDRVLCPGVSGENLATRALAAYRTAAPDAGLPAVEVTIEKRIPVAGGLAGGSADAAAVLRAATRLSARPLDPAGLHVVAATLGSDVPSQLAPRSALVRGAGEQVEPLTLAPMAFVLVPSDEGLSTPTVYAELDRLRAAGVAAQRDGLDPEAARLIATTPVRELAAAMENDLEAAALSLRPELTGSLGALRDAGALGARITGSGPTAFGVFAERSKAEAAALSIRGAIVAATR